MKVRFRTHRLRRRYEHADLAFRAWGRDVGERYLRRVTVMLEAERFEDLYSIVSLRLHPLAGERKGQYAMTLIGRWRLVISIEDDETVVVEEVSQHYGD